MHRSRVRAPRGERAKAPHDCDEGPAWKQFQAGFLLGRLHLRDFRVDVVEQQPALGVGIGDRLDAVERIVALQEREQRVRKVPPELLFLPRQPGEMALRHF